MMAILKDASPDKAAKIIREVIDQIKKGETPLEDLVIHTQLTKNPDKYQQMAPHVLAAKKSHCTRKKSRSWLHNQIHSG